MVQRRPKDFDAAEQAIIAMDGLGNRTTTICDAAGQTTEVDAAGHEVRNLNLTQSGTTITDNSFGYDGVGNRTSIRRKDGEYSNWTYTPAYALGVDIYTNLIAWGWKRLTPGWHWFVVKGNCVPLALPVGYRRDAGRFGRFKSKWSSDGASEEGQARQALLQAGASAGVHVLVLSTTAIAYERSLAKPVAHISRLLTSGTPDVPECHWRCD